MKQMAAILAAGIGLSAMGVGVLRAESDRSGKAGGPGIVFKLERQPLPAEDPKGLRSLGGAFLRPISELPSGIEAVDAVGKEFRFARARGGPRQIVIAKSSRQQKQRDRLYVDANGDGRFEPSECYDISRLGAPSRIITLRTAEGGRITLRLVSDCVVALKRTREKAGHPSWIKLEVYLGGGNAFIQCYEATCVVGQPRIGKRDVRIALYDALGSGRPDQGVKPLKPGLFKQAIDTGGQLLIDRNGNGTFDEVNLRGIGPENRWLTRLLRLDGKYYQLDVALEELSARLTPSEPKLGTVSVPAHIESGSIIGREFATTVTGEDKRIRLPAGRYALSEYRYRTSGGSLTVRRGQCRTSLRIALGQTRSLQVGPPMELRLSQGWGRSKPGRGRPADCVTLHIQLTDCAGRRIADLRNSKGERPDPPRFKIVDSTGRTVFSDAFKYG